MGYWRAKLDRHDFTGIFIGYTATNSNICYNDVHSGVVKSCHHAVFDECWFHQPWRLPAAQLLYDLGTAVSTTPSEPQPSNINPPSDVTPSVEKDIIPISPGDPTTPSQPDNPPPRAPPHQIPIDDDSSTASSDNASIVDVGPTKAFTINLGTTNNDATVVDHYGITGRDLEQDYFSPHHYGHAFEECFTYMGSPTTVHRTAGLELREVDGRVFIMDMALGTPCAKIPRWKSRLRNVCLLSVNDSPITTIANVERALQALPTTSRGTCKILVTSSELRDGLTYEGIPQISLDQLNPRHFFRTTPHNGYPSNNMLMYMISQSWDGGVLQYITRSNKLTRGVLLRQADWEEWQQSEFLQLDQYELQGMFGTPVLVKDGNAVFNLVLVWTYAVKEVDGRKKARCTCDGSTRGGQVRVLDYTYANSPDHMCSRLFYAIAAAENLMLFGADVSNAFAEAPPPKQGF